MRLVIALAAVVALALALFSFNKGLPLTIRSIFYPLLGERVWGWPGHIIDMLAVFATLFGLATSLGFGASQAAAGLNYLFGIPSGNVSMVLLIIGISGSHRAKHSGCDSPTMTGTPTRPSTTPATLTMSAGR